MDNNRVAILGCGFGCNVHLPAIRLAGGKVVAISDSGSGTSEKFCAQNDISFSSRSLTNLLDWGKFDYLLVAIPPNVQKDAVIDGLDCGVNVLCEKPFGISKSDAVEMEIQRKKVNKLGFVNYQFRFDPAFELLKHQLATECIGRVLRIEVRWLTSGKAEPYVSSRTFHHDKQLGGGALLSFMSHVINYVPWLLNKQITKLDKQTNTFFHQRKNEKGKLFNVSAEDSVNMIGFCEDVEMNLSVSNAIKFCDEHRVSIFGETGKLELCMNAPFRSKDKNILLTQIGGARNLKISEEDFHGDSRVNAVAGLWAEIFNLDSSDKEKKLPTFKDAIDGWSWLQ